MTRIAIRPCPERESEMLRQGGIHPVLARLFAARGLCDPKDLSSELAALMQPSGLLHIDEAIADQPDVLAEVDRAHALGLKGLYYSHDFSRHGYARNLDDDA